MYCSNKSSLCWISKFARQSIRIWGRRHQPQCHGLVEIDWYPDSLRIVLEISDTTDIKVLCCSLLTCDTEMRNFCKTHQFILVSYSKIDALHVFVVIADNLSDCDVINNFQNNLFVTVRICEAVFYHTFLSKCFSKYPRQYLLLHNKIE